MVEPLLIFFFFWFKEELIIKLLYRQFCIYYFKEQ